MIFLDANRCLSERKWKYMKKLLVLNAGSSEIMLINAAKRLGFYVITTGLGADLPGRRYAHQYVEADYSDHNAVLQLAKQLKIDAVCANANDEGFMTAVYVAEKLGLPGVWDSYEIAAIFHKKDLFKRFAKQNHFLTPQSETFVQAEEAVRYLETAAFPVIIKPVDRCGGLGVSEAADVKEGMAGVRLAFQMSKAGRIVIEEYLPGRQYDFHTFLIDGKLAYCSTSNEYSFQNPYRVNCLTIPADHACEITQMLVQETERMADILHLADGVLWIQYRIRDGRPWIIETGRRCGGNNMLDLLSRGFGTDFGEWVVRLETGLEYKDFVKSPIQVKCQGYQSLSPEKNGKIKGVHIADHLKKHIFEEYDWFQEGEEVTDYLYTSKGIVLFEYDTPEEMKKEIATINEDIRLIIE